MAESLVVHSGLLRECFLSRGRALLTSKINYVSRARPTSVARSQAIISGNAIFFQRALQKSKVQFHINLHLKKPRPAQSEHQRPVARYWASGGTFYNPSINGK